MKTAGIILMFLMLLPLTAADNVTYNNTTSPDYNESNETVNQTDWQLPDVNLSDVNASEIGEKFKNASQTGVEPLDNTVQFLIDASPFLLLIVGILVFIFSGVAKLIGILIIIIALIRLLQLMFF